MNTTKLGLLRRCLTGLWLGLVVGVLGLVGLSNLGPPTGHQPFIIRGGSMEPAIPLGSLVVTSRVAPGAISAGDIVSFKSPMGQVVTHRVIRVVEEPQGARFLETRGDANETADSQLVSTGSVVGRVDAHVPIAGYLLAFMSTLSGLISVLSMLGSVLSAIWLLEELESDEDPAIAANPVQARLAAIRPARRATAEA